MKMSSALVERALTQFPAQPVPDDHPAVAQLKQLFGDHTFFLDRNGLSIVEPTDSADARSAAVVELASWTDATCTSLAPHEPEVTDTVVSLDGAADGEGVH
ncbi:MAG TPA: hypothetical protein VFB45_01625 [Pseudolabrys sp.]|nr:hypothetical protein [Pseudolabrys sp.]